MDHYSRFLTGAVNDVIKIMLFLDAGCPSKGTCKFELAGDLCTRFGINGTFTGALENLDGVMERRYRP